jgi:Fe-S cluster assembly protein SufD
MNASPIRTEAEDQLSRHFAGEAPLLPGVAWVQEARRRAFLAFEAAGLPHRRIEAWKYTDLRNALGQAFPPARCSARKIDTTLLEATLGPALSGLAAIRLVLLNGRFVGRLLPAGHVHGSAHHVGPLSALLAEAGGGHEWLQPHFEANAADGGGDPVAALNAAFATDGAVLRIARDHELTLPVHIVSIVDADAPKAVATRHLVRIEGGASATVIESHVALGDAAVQATTVTHVAVEQGARLHHVTHVAAGPGSTHLGRLDVTLAEGAAYRGFQLTAGAGLLRNESRVAFTGTDARLDLSGLMLGRGRDHIDTTLVVDHTHPGCESRELFKAVLDDRARAVFQGKIVVAPEAQKTDGKQMAQSLMLSEDAEFDSKPELEIYADDVACGHGSTAAELDTEQMFYLRSRGLPVAEARAMLIESFAAEALDRIEVAEVREALSAVALGWLRNGR